MRFQVPQFIEVEDKVFGPLSIKQFLYLAGGIGFFVILYSILPFFLAVILGAPAVGLGIALAFVKVNEQPFVKTLEAAFHYGRQRKLYLWKKEDRAIEQPKEVEAARGLQVPKLSESKLKDLAWSLDIKEKGGIYSDPNQK